MLLVCYNLQATTPRQVEEGGESHWIYFHHFLFLSWQVLFATSSANGWTEMSNR